MPGRYLVKLLREIKMYPYQDPYQDRTVPKQEKPWWQQKTSSLSKREKKRMKKEFLQRKPSRE
jgi:hypothetical protein